MTAYEELAATGEFGPQTFELLRRLGRQYTRCHSFPPPQGYSRWDNDAVDDLLGALFEAKGAAIVLNLYVKSTGQASLERLLLTTIGNYLKDEAKGTERGKLRRRLTGLLEADEGFLRVPASAIGNAGWALAGGSVEPTAVGFADLERAAFGIRGVDAMRWNTAGPTPADTRDALLRVAHAVLMAAHGAVTDEQLARTVQSRFVLLHVPAFVELRPDEHDDRACGGDTPEGPLIVDEKAERLWQNMTHPERALYPHLGKPDPDLAGIMGTGPLQAHAAADALAERVRLATLDDPQHAEVARALLELCVVHL